MILSHSESNAPSRDDKAHWVIQSMVSNQVWTSPSIGRLNCVVIPDYIKYSLLCSHEQTPPSAIEGQIDLELFTRSSETSGELVVSNVDSQVITSESASQAPAPTQNTFMPDYRASLLASEWAINPWQCDYTFTTPDQKNNDSAGPPQVIPSSLTPQATKDSPTSLSETAWPDIPAMVSCIQPSKDITHSQKQQEDVRRPNLPGQPSSRNSRTAARCSFLSISRETRGNGGFLGDISHEQLITPLQCLNRQYRTCLKQPMLRRACSSIKISCKEDTLLDILMSKWLCHKIDTLLHWVYETATNVAKVRLQTGGGAWLQWTLRNYGRG